MSNWVKYIEPNYTLNNTTFNMEDYCIGVQLEVTIPKPHYSGKTQNSGEVIIISWKPREGDNVYNIMGGVKYGSKNYLTTSYTNPTYDGIKNNETNEMFGISSINIEYQNYSMPQVNIEFIDIMGAALFGVAEESHNGRTQMDISQKFFQSFFVFPKPLYKLTVKGFYGDPVTYELDCADFRARFNSTNGNFNATAKFVGRSFSLLTDITLNAILAAPLSPNGGIDYWQKRVNDGVFKCDDGQPLPTLTELMDKYKSLAPAVSELVNDDELSMKNKSLINEINEKETLKVQLEDLYDSILSMTVDGQKFIEFQQNNICYYIIIGEAYENDQILAKKQEASGINKDIFFRLIKLGEASKKDNVVTFNYNLNSRKKTDDVTYDIANAINWNNYIELINYKTDVYIQLYDHSKVLNDINKDLNTLYKQYNNNESQLNRKKNENVIKVLGITPSVYNITKIVMAHTETLLHLIRETGKTICNSERTKNILKPEYRNISISNTDFIPPFFDCLVNDEYTWIGKVVEEGSSEEVKLIDGLLLGINNVKTKIDNLNIDTNNTIINSNTKYNIIPSDFYITGENDIFDQNIEQNSENFQKIVSYRALLVSSLTNDDDCFNCGWWDAKNFVRQFGNTGNFISAICNEGLTSDNLYDCLLSNNIASESGLQYIRNDNYWLPYKNISTENSTIGKDSIYGYIYKVENSVPTYDDTIVNRNIASPIEIVDKKIQNQYLTIDLNYDDYINISDKFNEHSITSFDNFKFNQERWLKYIGDTKTMGNVTQHSLTQKTDVDVENTLPEGGNLNRYTPNSGYDFYLDNVNYKAYNIYDVFKDNNDYAVNAANDYTLVNFIGYKNKEYCEKSSIFAQKGYYELDDIYLKACAFLSNMAPFFSGNSGSFRKDIISVFTEPGYFEENAYNILPYFSLVILGAALWYKENNGKYNKYFKFSLADEDLKIRYNVTEVLTILFKNWVNDKFTKIDETYSLKFNKEEQTLDGFFEILKSGNHKGSDFNNYFPEGDVFFSAYSQYSINDNKTELILLNRIDNDVLIGLVNDLFKPCAVIFTRFKHPICLTTTSCIKKYYEGFIEGIKYLGNNENTNKGSTSTEDVVTSEHIKSSLYRYIKIIYDKWICCELTEYDDEHWNVDKYFDEHFHFIDHFYNYRTDVWVDLSSIFDTIQYSYSQNNYMLLNFLSNLYAKNNMALYPVQCFLSYNKGDNSPMDNLFTPMPYNSVDFNSNSYTDIVVMLNGEPSKKLNMYNSNGQNEDDVLLLNGNDDFLPAPMRYKDWLNTPIEYSKRSDNSRLKVPCFGVSYGMQYQSIFQDIEISMDNPIATEHSIKAYMDIIGKNKEGVSTSDNGSEKSIYISGNDLYTVYSNQSFDCKLTMMGNPWIQPLMYFTLLNVPMFRGSFLIKNVTHEISSGNMKTTVIGTRMSKNSIPTPNECTILKQDAPVVPYSNSNLNNNTIYANIDNDCPYVVYEPSHVSTTIDITMLKNTLVKDYVGNSKEWDDIFTKQYADDTIWDSLVSIVWGEYGDGGTELDRKLIAATMYNRIVHEGSTYEGLRKNVCNYTQYNGLMFNNDYFGDNGVDNVTNRKNHNSGKRWIESENALHEIFKNTPSILVGKRVTPKVSVNIYEKGNITSNKTTSRLLEMEDVRCMWFYVRYDWYSNGIGNASEHRRYIYQFHHNDHLFTTAEQYKYCWSEESITNNDELQKYLDFVECVKKTCSKSENLGINNINVFYTSDVENQGIWLSTTAFTKDDEKDYKLFDVILNAYGDKCNIIQCVMPNINGSDGNPVFIRVILGNNKQKQLGVVYSSRGGSKYQYHFYQITSSEHLGTLNDDFYKSMAKYFRGGINDDNRDILCDFRNFINIDTEVLNEYIRNKVSPCTDVIQSSINSCRS